MIFSRIYFWWYIHLKYGLHLRKPFYVFRVLRNLIKAKFYSFCGSKKFVLRGIDFAVTYLCNFNCEHCYAQRLQDRTRQMMSIQDYKRVCRQAMGLGCLCFSLQGGEVFMRKDWEEIIKAFKPNYNHILLTTNGSLITEDLVKRLRKLGLDTLYFSVDSGIAREHDDFRRQQGSFEKIMQAVGFCKKHKVKIVFNTCVTKQSLYSEGLKRILDYSHKNRILLETIFARCLGNFAGQKNVMLDEEDLRYYYNLRRSYPFVVRDLDNNYGRWGCPALKEVLYITAYGDVCPCPYSHVIIGNVKKESLQDIRNRGLSSSWFNHYHQECLTALDKEFMQIYYPLVEKSPLINLENIGDGSSSNYP